MARTIRAERHRRRESALVHVSQGKGVSDVLTAQMSQWGCSRSPAKWDCRWEHDQLQLGLDSHDAQHLMVHMATSLQRISLKAEESGQFAAAVGAHKKLYELLLRRKMDHEAAKASRPGGVIDTAIPVPETDLFARLTETATTCGENRPRVWISRAFIKQPLALHRQ